ncbi:hypothetical protein FMJ29_08415 [Klebsiella michiganensis]|uniref:hypothetical protein n=1 Tax=Klebsiella michiganensis TaxID=1134687 RepID=UPI001CCB84B3|nr:hypothetical protein [Klebsiella michiganensis]MBZ7458990.1 hypothetical protein [Klebsiella michiganensis]
MNKGNEIFYNRLEEIEIALGKTIRKRVSNYYSDIIQEMNDHIDDLKDLTDEALSSPFMDDFDRADFQGNVINLLEDFKNCREAVIRIHQLQNKIPPRKIYSTDAGAI